MTIPETPPLRKPQPDNAFGAAGTNGHRPAGLWVPDVPPSLTLLDAALAYAEAGWYLVPTDPNDVKNPGSVVGGKWHEKSSRDPEQIGNGGGRRTRTTASHLHCGRSGAIAFDLDVGDLNSVSTFGRADIAEALVNAGAIQGTRSEGDRGHYLYLMPPNKEFGNSAGAFMAWGEVRGKNGGIVVAPTPHPDAGTKGGCYRWAKVGVVGALPDVLRECLCEAADSADPLTDAELEAFQDTYSGDGCGHEGCRNSIAGPAKQFRDLVAGGARQPRTREGSALGDVRGDGRVLPGRAGRRHPTFCVPRRI